MDKFKKVFSKVNDTTLRLLVMNLIIFVIFSVLQPTRFLTLFNFESMSFQFPEVGLFTLGIGITMLTAGADLSIVAVANLVATVNGLILLKAVPAGASFQVQLMFVVLCIFVAIIIGIIAGSLNGFLVAKLNIFPILATLGTQNLFAGISMILTKGQGVFGVFPEPLQFIGNGKLLGLIPMPLLMFILILAIVYVIIEKSAHGFKTQWYGSNNKASFFSGIDNVKTVFRTYMLASIIGALTGILILARTNSAKYDYGTSYVLQAMLASVLAGISPLGGVGKISNVFLSIFAIQMLDSGFNFLKISSFVRSSAYGLLLIISISMEYYINKRKEKRFIEQAKVRRN